MVNATVGAFVGSGAVTKVYSVAVDYSVFGSSLNGKVVLLGVVLSAVDRSWTGGAEQKQARG